MKAYLSSILGILIFSFISVQAQQNNTVSITGTVLDDNTKEPIQQASIRVLNPVDSSYVNGAATTSEGKFSVSVKPGNYIVNVSFIGFTEVAKNINAQQPQNSLGTIGLKEDGILLSEAVVVAKTPEIVVKGDTIEYNADSYKVQESAVVEDLLKKMPGAEVDSEGKITINGKEVKKILVDGEEFFSDDPKVASKNLPAKMVDKLQVLDRKSDMAQMTGFDDGDEETVINLTVKPGMKQGIFGNAFVGAGNKDRYEANGMINYMKNSNQFTVIVGSNNTNNAGFSDFASSAFGDGRPARGMNFGGNNGITKSTSGGFNFSNKINDDLKWGGNVRYGNTDNDVERHSYTQNYREAGDQFETRNSFGNNKSDNFNANIRLEWTPDTLTKIIFRPNFRYNKNTNSQISDYITTYEDPQDSINWGNSKYFSKGDGTNFDVNLDISRTLGKPGRVLSFSLSGGINNQTSDGMNWSETYFRRENVADSLSTIDQIFKQKNDGYNFRGYVSYVEPLGKNNFLQLAYSYRRNHSESDRNTFKYNDTEGSYNIVDVSSTKRLENDFTNQQIELNFKSVRENFNYTIGFAVQPSQSDSWEYSPKNTADSVINTSTSVVNFAPVGQFIYRWNRQTNLRIDYNGRVNQPSARQLSTAIDESNPMNVTYGNPDLKPSFTNNLRVQYRKSNPENASTFMVFGNFRFINNDIVNNSFTDSIGKRTTTYENVNGNWNANARMIINRPLPFFNKKLSINSMTYFSYSQSNGFINADKNTQKNYGFHENLGFEYRSDLFDFGIRGNFQYTGLRNSIHTSDDDNNNSNLYNYGGRANTTIYLPYDFTIESDLNFSKYSGYTDGFNQSEWLWNASLSKQIFKAKNGTIRIKIYDILQQRNNISQNITTDYLQQTITNTLNSYFMVHFVYRFQSFGKGTSRDDMQRSRGDGPGGFRGGPPPMM